MELKHFIFVLCFLYVNIFWPQFSTGPVYFGPQLSIQAQAQQVNPASFLSKGRASLLCQGATLIKLPGLQQLSVNLSLPQQRLALHQHFAYQGISSFQILTYMSNVGIALSPTLKVGLGIGVQTIFQEAPYGTKWSGLTKFGLQYQPDENQYLGLTFELNTPFEQAALKFAYANQMSPELICYAHIMWYQLLPPQFFFGIEQKMDNYIIKCTAALQPQFFGFALEKQSKHRLMWSVGLQWQNRVGLALHWGFRLNKP